MDTIPHVIPTRSEPLRWAHSHDWTALAWMFPEGIAVFFPITRSLAFWHHKWETPVTAATPLVLSVGSEGHVALAWQEQAPRWKVGLGVGPPLDISANNDLLEHNVWDPRDGLLLQGTASRPHRVHWGREIVRFLRWQTCHNAARPALPSLGPDLPGGMIVVDRHPVLSLSLGFRPGSGIFLHHKDACQFITAMPSRELTTWTRLGGRILGNLDLQDKPSRALDIRNKEGIYRVVVWPSASQAPCMRSAMEDFRGDVWVPAQSEDGKFRISKLEGSDP